MFAYSKALSCYTFLNVSFSFQIFSKLRNKVLINFYSNLFPLKVYLKIFLNYSHASLNISVKMDHIYNGGPIKL